MADLGFINSSLKYVDYKIRPMILIALFLATVCLVEVIDFIWSDPEWGISCDSSISHCRCRKCNNEIPPDFAPSNPKKINEWVYELEFKICKD